MAPTKKPSSAPKTRSSTSAAPTLKKVKGENFYRSAKDAKRLKMLTGGKPIRDKDGKIIQAAAYQKGEDETKPGRVQPDRRWFGNTRVITQSALDHFRTSLESKKHDPYSVLLRRNKLPMALLDDAKNPNTQKRSHIVETEPFKDTFGPKAQRKKPRLDVGTFEELSKLGESASADADDQTAKGEPSAAEFASTAAFEPTHADLIEPIYAKGTSRRIFGELYKVLDSSDVVVHVLDARDPLGTLCESVLTHLRTEKAHKHVVLLLNKCDLVPNWVTARYLQHLGKRYPTLAFHASPRHAFGKGALIQLLRQFAQLHADKKQISVGFVGYPNVGKSSVINTIKSGKVCRVAPVPGETKVWQYIALTRRIYLIDCPGVVPGSHASDTRTDTVLKGVVRVEALAQPSEHVPALLERVKPVYLARTYGLPLPDPADDTKTWEAETFLDRLARSKGRLLKGGEPDMEGAAKIVLSDWTRGRVPFFVPPPERPEEVNAKEAKERERSEKAKAREEKVVPGVKQNLRSIIQKNTFVGDDVRPVDVEEEEGEEVDEEAEAESEEEEVEAVEEEEVEEEEEEEEVAEEEELSWGDVFPADAPAPADSAPPSPTSTKQKDAVEDSDDAASESEAPTKKGARMKTNKRKAANFYTSANVKNKNRKRAALMKALPVGKRAVR